MTRSSRHHRPERLAALIQQTLAEALATRLKDPRVGFITITGVTVAPDGSHATVRVSVLGDEETKQQALAGLQSARGFLRTQLARQSTMRITPDLAFVLDRGIEHAQRINQVLADLKRPPDAPPEDA
jgi:ribosome-binding factor A